MQDKPIRLNCRTTIPNKVYLEDLKLKHKAEGISEIVRKIFYNAEELYRNGIDIYDVYTVKKIREIFDEEPDLTIKPLEFIDNAKEL